MIYLKEFIKSINEFEYVDVNYGSKHTKAYKIGDLLGENPQLENAILKYMTILKAPRGKILAKQYLNTKDPRYLQEEIHYINLVVEDAFCSIENIQFVNRINIEQSQEILQMKIVENQIIEKIRKITDYFVSFLIYAVFILSIFFMKYLFNFDKNIDNEKLYIVAISIFTLVNIVILKLYKYKDSVLTSKIVTKICGIKKLYPTQKKEIVNLKESTILENNIKKIENHGEVAKKEIFLEIPATKDKEYVLWYEFQKKNEKHKYKFQFHPSKVCFLSEISSVQIDVAEGILKLPLHYRKIMEIRTIFT